MKKNITLSIALYFCFASQLFSQINFIRDGSFEETSFNVESSNTVFPEEKGVWFPYIDVNQSVMMSTEGDEHQGTVVSIKTLSSVSNSYIGQRIEGDLSPIKYTLAFSAKTLETNIAPNVNVCLKIKTASHEEALYFKLADVSDKTTIVGGAPFKSFSLSNHWEYFSVTFDLSKVVKLITKNISKAEIREASTKDLSDFYVIFSCPTPNVRIRFTEVSLSKSND